MRAAVVGHLEWVEFVRVDHVPRAGEIVHATGWWAAPAGGGAGTAAQLARLTERTVFYTAVGNDELGRASIEALRDLGIDVQAVVRDEPTRRGFSLVDRSGERTITVLGERLGPTIDDPLPWADLADTDAVYITAGDPGAVRAARSAGVVVATARALPLLRDAAVELDALVGSGDDPSETYHPGDLDPPPRLVVRTQGSQGGTVQPRGEEEFSYAAAPLPGPIVDRYGAGDAFAGGLAFALAAGRGPAAAVAFGARCSAAVLTGAGPYAGQVSLQEIEAWT